MERCFNERSCVVLFGVAFKFIPVDIKLTASLTELRIQ